MSKSQKKSNKEIRKPKAVKSAEVAPTLLPLGAGATLGSLKKRK